MNLVTEPNLTQSDDFYASLLAVHQSLGPDESAALNARLILILANHIGDLKTLEQALELAAKS